MTLRLQVAFLLALATTTAAADQPCPVGLSAPVRGANRTLTMPDGSSFEAPLWGDGSRACPCLQRGCIRKCCPAGYVSDIWGDCVPVSRNTISSRLPLTPAQDRQSPDKHLARLDAFVPKLVSLVERLQNSSGGIVTTPVDSSGGVRKDEVIRNLSSALLKCLPAAPDVDSGKRRLSSDDCALLSTTADGQLSTVRLREAVRALSIELSNVYPTAADADSAGVGELVDELKEYLANISTELSENNTEVVDDKERVPGAVETLLSLIADKTQAPLRDMFVLYGTACPCNRYEVDDAFEMLDNGTLTFESFMVPASDYCLDETVGGNLTLYLCFPETECPLEEKDALFFYPAGTVLSLPFLAATFVVYALFEELRNRVGTALMCYVAALFVAYALLAAVQISLGYVSIAFCLTAAFIIYFSFLASFFWLNVMCFDIFWTFSGFRSLRGTAREREHKKFIIYSIYSWGCPLILLSVTLVMQFHNDIPDGLLRPQFGVKKCWFPDDITILAYFYGPVGVLVLCNIILFILTAIRIAQLKRETAMLKGTDSRRHDDDNRQRFNLYLKLFLVMGVNWSMEVISGLVGGPDYVWYVTDICNTLQGVLIFVIFVWKDRIRRMLMEKFCPKRASTKLSKSTVVTYSTRASPSRLSHGVLNNKVTDNSNGDVVKITAVTPISDDSDVP
ncbi:G-protein coupled receptor Mth2-like isoform X1 [Schistocerca serialis cubense]|uniref:G-protein coupled receptor Mth2-like isoform X1 n=1 Tax=Schistocerca serialis cubense TaxID=2023355 RepID=UPI00214F2DD3|nr:G-protein coupled receptor Mth2-like isoform X1 [Schistocerca serialis cubense]